MFHNDSASSLSKTDLCEQEIKRLEEQNSELAAQLTRLEAEHSAIRKTLAEGGLMEEEQARMTAKANALWGSIVEVSRARLEGSLASLEATRKFMAAAGEAWSEQHERMIPILNILDRLGL